jgi:FixJ family two-component response regulator
MKVLFMSGYTDKVLMSTAAWETGTAFLQKPFTPQTLGDKVREMLEVLPPHQTARKAA